MCLAYRRTPEGVWSLAGADQPEVECARKVSPCRVLFRATIIGILVVFMVVLCLQMLVKATANKADGVVPSHAVSWSACGWRTTGVALALWLRGVLGLAASGRVFPTCASVRSVAGQQRGLLPRHFRMPWSVPVYLLTLLWAS